MVYVNNRKYACTGCIKGHRSSLCGHNDRALFEIKKKGRPRSQCEHCRELRRTRQIHKKCICEADDDDGADPSGLNGEVSMYPNGLTDILSSVSVRTPYPGQGSKFETILNQCICLHGEPCKCRTPVTGVRGVGSSELLRTSCDTTGRGPFPTTDDPLSPEHTTDPCCPTDVAHASYRRSSRIEPKKKNSCCSGRQSPVVEVSSTSFPEPSNMGTFAHDDSNSTFVTPYTMPAASASQPCSPRRGSCDPKQPLHSSRLPESTSRCNCGASCRCPGYRDHHPSMMPPAPTQCFGTIVGIAAPGASLSASFSASTTCRPSAQEIIGAFLERQAVVYGLPPAPSARANITRLDGSSTFVLPPAAVKDLSGPVARASGITNVRRMICCAGRCACPAGRCGCEESCEGEKGCTEYHGHV